MTTPKVKETNGGKKYKRKKKHSGKKRASTKFGKIGNKKNEGEVSATIRSAKP